MSDLGAQIPFPQTPFLNDQGHVTQIWYMFLQQIFNRVGGSTTPSMSLPQVEGSVADVSGLLQSDTHTQANADKLIELETWLNEQLSIKLSRIEERLQELQVLADFSFIKDYSALANRMNDLENHVMAMQKPVDPIIQNYINVTTFLNGWSNYGAPYATAGYFKDLSNQVRLRGVVTGGTSGATIFVLPPGYRPEFTTIYPATTIAGGSRNIIIDPSGNVNPDTGTSASFSLSGLTFKAL